MRTRQIGVAIAAFALAAGLVAAVTTPGAATVPEPPLHKDLLRLDLPVIADGEVLAVQQHGDRIYVGGIFSTIEVAGVPQSHPYFAAFDLSTGGFLSGFSATFNNEVWALELSPDGETLYVGGTFTAVNGVDKRRIVKLNALTGAVDPAFTATADARVRDLALHGTTLYAGGIFDKVNNQPRTRLAAVDAATGAVDPGFAFTFSDPEGGSTRNGSSVRSIDISPDGNRLLVVHLNRFIDGNLRTGVAMIDTSGPTATLSPWSTRIYEDTFCAGDGVWVRDGKFSPDGSYFVVVGSGHDYPPACDSAVKWATNDTPNAQPLWVSRHMDTIEAVAIDHNVIYTGGHFRFQESLYAPEPWHGTSDNPAGGTNQASQGAFGGEIVIRHQLGALDPTSGAALPWTIDTNGHRGVLTLEVGDRGLLIGQDGPDDGSPARIGAEPIGRFGIVDRGPEPLSDRTPPTLTGLSTLATESGVRLSWALTDNDVPDGVRIYRDGAWIGSSSDTSFMDTTATGSHTYQVVGYDRSGNKQASGFITAAPAVTNATNVAPGGVAAQLTTAFDGFAPRAIDGDTNGSYPAGSVTHTEDALMQWWEVDLGAVREVDRVVLWNRTDCCGDRLRDLSVLVSRDPFTSDSYWAARWKAGVTSFDIDNELSESFTIPIGVEARYVRIHRRDSGVLSLAEVQVFAQPTAAANAGLVVVGDADNLTTGDEAIVQRLENHHGLAVGVVDGSDLLNLVPNAYDYVWVTASGALTPRQRTMLAVSAAPVIVSRPWLLDDLGLTGGTPGTDHGSRPAANVTIVATDHPLAASLEGLTPVVSATARLTFGVPTAAATIVAEVDDQATLFAYERGDLLANGAAAAGCRLVFPAGIESPAAHTADGWALFDAAVAHARGPGCER